MSRNGNYIIFFTSNNYFRVFDMSHRKYVQKGRSRKFEDNSGLLGKITNCSINCTGTQVIIIYQEKSGTNTYMPSRSFYVYDIELDTYNIYTLKKNRIPT